MPPVALVPALFKILLIPALSVPANVMVNWVAESISTFDVPMTGQVPPPSPVKVSLPAVRSLVAPLALTRFVPVTTSTPVVAS